VLLLPLPLLLLLPLCCHRRSKVLQSLPPVLFTLAKSTEPWSDEYYSFDLEGALRQAGFTAVESTQPDSRHRTVFGIAA
jgi:hypothetical protein